MTGCLGWSAELAERMLSMAKFRNDRQSLHAQLVPSTRHEQLQVFQQLSLLGIWLLAVELVIFLLLREVTGLLYTHF